MTTADKKTRKRFINFKILANIEETNQNVELTVNKGLIQPSKCKRINENTYHIPIENKKK